MRRPPGGRRRLPRLGLSLLGAVVALALVAAAAFAVQRIHEGELVIEAEGGFAPTSLPRHMNAPITLHGGGSISTSSGALPPIINELTILFDRHGSVETTGLPVCTMGRLQATTSAAARRVCPESIVGEGEGKAVIAFPEQRPITLSSPIILFNGPPKHGDPTVIAHAYLSNPVSATYLVPIVIERIHQGVYGYRTEATIPVIAGGAGVPISGHLRIGKRWTYKGKKYSYVNARCETGKLQAKGEFTFAEDTRLEATFIKPCKARG
jgi:hypothetical protein